MDCACTFVYDPLLPLVLCSLCRKQSNKTKGAPFRPVRATPVDLFPHTKHCELVVLFERQPPEPTAAQEDKQLDGGHEHM